MEKLCSLCKAKVDSETAPLLTMGGFGNPKYICEECDADLNTATLGREISEISSAMDRISKKMLKSGVTDEQVLTTVEEIMESASSRAEKIKSGEYDFSSDEENEESFEEEIPEELRESEEDREKAEAEEKTNKKLEKITNVISLLILLAVLGYLGYRIITTYFF